MSKKISSIIQLRRDNDYNFEPIKNTFIPANGEVVLVDTASNGLRAKVGDGQSTYAELPFAGTGPDSNNGLVIQGFFIDDEFWADDQKTEKLDPNLNHIYIDKSESKLYYYDGVGYIIINDTLYHATDIVPGIMKLYSNTGNNTDGTMTQKAITDELNKKYEVQVDDNDELLTFIIT